MLVIIYSTPVVLVLLHNAIIITSLENKIFNNNRMRPFIMNTWRKLNFMCVNKLPYYGLLQFQPIPNYFYRFSVVNFTNFTTESVILRG